MSFHYHSLVVENVSSSETEAWQARVEVVPLVQCICHGDRLILILIVVRVSHERRLPVIVKHTVRHTHVGAPVGDVKQTIVVVLVVVLVRGKINVVDPYLHRGLNPDRITSLGEHLANLEIADDHVFRVEHT